MTSSSDSKVLLELAAKCERHAAHHFAIAADNNWSTDTSVDLHNIDLGLACLERAAALRARSSTTSDLGGEEAR